MHSLKIDKDEKCRIRFNEITKDAIKEAIKNPSHVDMSRVDSQQARRVLDRLVGYKLSPLLWRKVKKGLSAGRVQSVAVRLICEREDEITNFVPEEYWSLIAKFKLSNKAIFEAKLAKKDNKKLEIKSKEQMDEVLKDLKNKNFLIQQIKKQIKSRTPAAPFITSSLQQEAYKKINFTAKKTMRIAQQLYEGIDIGKEGTIGLISYIRTDSTRISESAQKEAQEYITEKFGTKYLPEKPRTFKKKDKIQNAHEAIRPTSVLRDQSK